MRIVDFNRLPPDARQRLIGSFAGTSPPYPILAQRTSFGLSTFGWLCVAAAGFVLGAARFATAFGRPYSFHQPLSGAAVYALSLFLIVGPVFTIVRNAMRKSRLPFPAGTYLLPVDLVEALDAHLKVWSLTELEALQPTHHYTNGAYTHTAFVFSFQGGKKHHMSVSPKAKAEQALETLRAVRAQVQVAIDQRDVASLANLDAFMTARLNDAWDKSTPDAGPQAGRVPAPFRHPWLLAIVPAVVLAAPVHFARNFLSDRAAYSALNAYGSVNDCNYYIRQGGSRTTDVRDVVLPRVALRDAVSEAETNKSSLPVRLFLKRYPHSMFQAEAERALTKAIATDFAAAKAAASVTSMRRFLSDNPGSPFAAEAGEQIHRMFQNTLTTFRAKASTADPNMVPFVEALIAQLEKHDSPAVAVRFVRGATNTLATADKLIEKSLTPEEAAKGFAKASPYFDDTKSKQREETLVQLIQKAFGTVFPADILTFVRDGGESATGQKAKPVADMDATELEDEIFRRSDASGTGSYGRFRSSVPHAASPVPTGPVVTPDSPLMSMLYLVNWSGSTYEDEKTNRMFVGIRVSFDFEMSLPGMTRPKVCPQPKGTQLPEGTRCPLAFFLDVKPPKHFSVKGNAFLDRDYFAKGGAEDGMVYEVMAARAYDELSMRLQNVFFAEAVHYDAADLAPSKPKAPITIGHGPPGLPPTKPTASPFAPRR